MPFKVLVDDNFHYMDDSERYELGTFPTLEPAAEAARLVVDEYLQSAYEPGMTSDTLLETYLSFGEDPFTVSTGGAPSGVLFSARDYGRTRCEAMCRQVEVPPEGLTDPISPQKPSDRQG